MVGKPVSPPPLRQQRQVVACSVSQSKTPKPQNQVAFFMRWDVVFPIRVGDETSTHGVNVFGIKGRRYANPIFLYLERKEKMMRTLILSTLSTLALLIYPLSLSAQNSFSLSVDLNSTAGDQAVTSLNTAPNQVVAIQIFGKDIQNANGLSMRFEYDAGQVTYEGFDVGTVLPNAQALPLQGTGYVEIGIASLGGQATVNSGLAGTIRFRTTGVFTSTAIRLVRADLGRGGRFETIMPNISIALQGAPPPANFSLSLDVNGSAGDQAVTSANISTDEIVAIEIFGKDIQNANGLSVRFEYDANQVTYEGFDVGNVLPSAQALPSQGINPTFVEIGIVSFGGQATANSGLFGTIRFRTTAAFSGTAIRLVRAELGRGGRFETIMPNSSIALQGASTPTNFSLSLDVDGAAGDQAVTSLNTAPDQVIAIQIFGKDIQNANGLSIRFEYDAGQVTYEGFDVGNVLPSAQALPEQGINPTYIEIGIVSFGGQATVNSGLIGTIRFRTTGAFTSTTIRLVRAELGRGGQIKSVTIDVRVALELQALTPDFNGDGMVNFADFLVLTNLFGAYQGDGRYEAKYDLDSDGTIGFGDFLIFSSSFGKGGSPPGGGDGSSPDLIVESPSVSDSTLTVRQSFTLQATIRNQGSGQAAATTLHYYQSGDAIISSSDTRVGSEAVGPLNASSRSVESINLHAPSSVGTYYYGACVASVSGESNTENNCSRAVRVTVSSGSTTNVDIPDANLRAVIEDSFGKASGAPISRAELASLTRLEAPNSNISDLTGLEYATNLTRLDLGAEWVSRREVRNYMANFVQRRNGANSNEISNLSPLSGLTRLEYLNLGSNLISDVSVLSGLTSLIYLDLYDNYISDVSALSNLTNLTSLDLYNNIISDVSALSSITRLEKLFLGINLISDVSVLANLTNLETLNLEENLISNVSVLSRLTRLADLDIGENTISDISVLANLTGVKWLDLEDNEILDVSVLANLTRLERLFLDHNAISALSPLSNLTDLTDLELSDNVISDISVLANLNNLTRLTLSDNLISVLTPLSNLNNLERLVLNRNPYSDLTPLSYLINLTNLQTWDNNISDVSPLSGLTNLRVLYLHGNPVSDVSALSGLTNLRFIGLHRTAITDVSALVSALSGLTNLRELFLADNAISDISALSVMTNLTGLTLFDNSISDISALSGLTNLRRLYLSTNIISDISPLVANMGLGSGDEVDVRDNPLSATSLNTHIPALQARGVEVRFGASKPGVEETEPRMLHPENEDIMNGGRP